MSALRPALWGLRREWRGGELLLLTLALIVAVAAVSSVAIFSQRVALVLELQAADLLAADLRIRDPGEEGDRLAAEAVGRSLVTTRTITMASVVGAGERIVLASAKGVAQGYPLRGQLRSRDSLQGKEWRGGAPAPGEAWADPRIFHTLSVEPGATITLGHATLRLTRVLTHEPDRGMGFSDLAPRLLFHLDDLESTGLLLPGSRARHYLLVAGERHSLLDYRDWLDSGHAPPGARIEDVRQARPQLRVALERASTFLHLSALVSVILAGVAVTLSARRYARRHLDGAAVMRCLGVPQRRVVAVHLWQLGVLAGIALPVGALAGLAVQELLFLLLGQWFPVELPSVPLWPLLVAMLLLLVALAGFALPPLLALGRTPPMRVLRHESPASSWRERALAVAGLSALALLVAWQADDQLLALIALCGVAAASLLLYLLARLTMVVVAGPASRLGGGWRWGFNGIHRRQQATRLQVVAIGIGIMALLLLGVVRVDLIEQWQASVATDSPNHFMLNVQDGERQAIRERLLAEGGPEIDLLPMVRGRLVAINGEPVVIEDYPPGRPRRLVSREFNLSWASELPPGNRVVAGEWWQGERPAAGFSVEKGLAETLGIALGDRLRYRVGGSEVSATVTSLRELKWESFRVNFFVIASPGVLDGMAATWISSFHLPAERAQLISAIVAEWPTVTVIDVGALIDQARRVVDRVTAALELVFLFTLAAGGVVLVAAIQSTMEERQREIALLRSLGASRGWVWRGVVAEFGLIGVTTGIAATLIAMLAGWGVSYWLLDLPFRPSVWLIAGGPLAGLVALYIAALIGVRKVVEQPPLRQLMR